MKWDSKKIFGVILGLIISGIMLFANQLGLDNDPIWGINRTLFFLLGIFILLVSLFYKRENFIGQLFHTEDGQLYLGSGVVVLSVILIYVWCISVGLWTRWPESTSYYDMLATSFSHGHIALEVEPDPTLIALEKPYEPGNREGIPVLWDASYYQGKYYFYWGPAPAFPLALIKPIYSKVVGDNILTFLYFVGTFIFLAILILHLHKNYFPEAPPWSVLLGITFVGLVNPIPFALLDAHMYEVAIGGGQFFFVGGLYWLFRAFGKPSAWWLALAGTFFALAVGSRNILALPVAFLALVVLIWVIKTQRSQSFKFILAIFMPLILGAVSYAWYNYARFGDITEFGFRYQLTSFNLYENIDETFSLSYIPPNLFKTLVNPLERRDAFPFIRAIRWIGPTWLDDSMSQFYLYYAEAVTGLLVGSPFVIFAFLAGLRKKKGFDWIFISLAGSTLLIFFTLQVFFYTVMRYHIDLLPALSILAVIGFWQGLHWLEQRPVARISFALLGIILMAYSFVISFLLTISSHLQRFQTHNPDLLEKLNWTFNRIIK
jgi:hypothetical protein